MYTCFTELIEWLEGMLAVGEWDCSKISTHELTDDGNSLAKVSIYNS